MGIITPNSNKKEVAAVNYNNVVSKSLLLIFTRNPELGKCKTRLASKIGDRRALDIYRFLLKHTVSITRNLNVAKQVWYSEEIWENDIWESTIYEKKLQSGEDLGERMANAFLQGFQSVFDKIVIIGSDMYDLNESDLQNAFELLNKNDFVVGPAEDGGYYLLGMRTFKSALFKDKDWGKETVLEDTLIDLKEENIHLLDVRNDVDYYEDIRDIDAFQPYLKDL